MGERKAKSKIEFEFVSWEDIHKICVELYTKIQNDRFQPDVLIGVARGGWGPARILSDLFNDTRVASMKIEFYTDISETAKKPQVMQPVSTEVTGKSLLVVDDVADSGLSLQVAVEHLKARKAKEVRTTTLYYKPWSIVTPDYYARETRAWLVFAHEMAEFMRLRMKNQEIEGGSPETLRNEFIQLGIPEFLVDLIAMEKAENALKLRQ